MTNHHTHPMVVPQTTTHSRPCIRSSSHRLVCPYATRMRTKKFENYTPPFTYSHTQFFVDLNVVYACELTYPLLPRDASHGKNFTFSARPWTIGTGSRFFPCPRPSPNKPSRPFPASMRAFASLLFFSKFFRKFRLSFVLQCDRIPNDKKRTFVTFFGFFENPLHFVLQVFGLPMTTRAQMILQTVPRPAISFFILRVPRMHSVLIKKNTHAPPPSTTTGWAHTRSNDRNN